MTLGFLSVGLGFAELAIMLFLLLGLTTAVVVVLVVVLPRRSKSAAGMAPPAMTAGKPAAAPGSGPAPAAAAGGPVGTPATPEAPARACPQCGAAIGADAPEGLCPACLAKAGLAADTLPMDGTADGAEEGAGVHAPPAAAAADPAEIAKHFPQLEILELLGRGGMGAVYKARQPQLDRLVALKVLPAELAQAPGFADRFMREARALARLNHPNIVAVYDFGQAEGLFYFIMEYVDGSNLRQMITAGKITPEAALAIVPRICEALQFAHDEGVLHRDIKPENILVDRKGRVKIADFGLAKIAGTAMPDVTLTQPGMLMGTPRYMAPEQVENAKSVDHRADIYSLGVVFYEMLTGELPLGRFAPPSQKVRVDVRLDDVVLHTLEKEPARRYQHASDVKTAVETISGAAPAAAAAPAFDPADPALREVRAPAAGLVVTAVLNWVALLVVLPTMVVYVAARKTAGMPGMPTYVPALAGIVLAAGSALILWGALRMRRLESLGLARTAAILAMIVGPGYLVGWPVGIWALVALSRPEVKAAFLRRRQALAGLAPAASAGGRLGTLSLTTAIGGLVLPLLIGVGWSAASPGMAANDGRLVAVCFLTGVALELVALGCGIAARRTASGKAGMIVSGIALPLYAAVWIVLFAATPVSRTTAPVTARSYEYHRMAFGSGDRPLSTNLVADGGGWTAECATPQTLKLFEASEPGFEGVTMLYKARVKAEDVRGRVYLEMWCRLPGTGEFFSRGLDQAVTGTTDGWVAMQAPFFLKPGQRPDLVRLNLVVEGPGRVGIRDIELSAADPRRGR